MKGKQNCGQCFCQASEQPCAHRKVKGLIEEVGETRVSAPKKFQQDDTEKKIDRQT